MESKSEVRLYGRTQTPSRVESDQSGGWWSVLLLAPLATVGLIVAAEWPLAALSGLLTAFMMRPYSESVSIRVREAFNKRLFQDPDVTLTLDGRAVEIHYTQTLRKFAVFETASVLLLARQYKSEEYGDETSRTVTTYSSRAIDSVSLFGDGQPKRTIELHAPLVLPANEPPPGETWLFSVTVKCKGRPLFVREFSPTAWR